MSEIEKKITVIKSKLRSQQISITLITVTVFSIVLVNFSLIGKFNRIVEILEKVTYLLDSLIK